MGQPVGLAEGQQRTLERLRPLLAGDHLYLAGGTAVAHHLGHRRSLDLDRVRARLVSGLPDLKVLSITDATLRVRIAETPVDIVSYPYPPLEHLGLGPAGFPIAGRLDLATMKLTAIARRGIRRDFWDLHALVQSGISLEDAAGAYHRRFGVAEADLYHVLRALTYFEDGDREAVFPLGLDQKQWETIKAYFRAEAPKVLLAR